MRNTIDLIQTGCQEIRYRYDFTAYLKHGFIEKDRHLVKAIKSDSQAFYAGFRPVCA